jgi:hypothetical protein
MWCALWGRARCTAECDLAARHRSGGRTPLSAHSSGKFCRWLFRRSYSRGRRTNSHFSVSLFFVDTLTAPASVNTVRHLMRLVSRKYPFVIMHVKPAQERALAFGAGATIGKQVNPAARSMVCSSHNASGGHWHRTTSAVDAAMQPVNETLFFCDDADWPDTQMSADGATRRSATPRVLVTLSLGRFFARSQPNQRMVAGFPLIEAPDAPGCRARVR